MIEVNKNECFLEICITIGESKFRIGYFMGGYDYILYVEPSMETIRMRFKNPGMVVQNLFEISKDSEFYECFDRLYENIANWPFLNEISEDLIACDIYKKIYDKNRNSIIWQCDDGYDERNYFEIKKTDIGITVIFNEIHFGKAVRISTSGSQYGNFYLPFVELFKELMDLYELKKSQFILKK